MGIPFKVGRDKSWWLRDPVEHIDEQISGHGHEESKYIKQTASNASMKDYT